MELKRDGPAQALANIMAAAEQANAPVDGDYIATDGLLYCGKCRTPKQSRITILGSEQTVYQMCQCATDEFNAMRTDAAEKSRANRIQDMRHSGFSDAELLNCTFDLDDGQMPHITDICRRYADSFERFRQDGKGLLFWGLCGTGKTFFASCIANAVIDKGYPALVTNFARLTNNIQATFEGRQEIINSLGDYSLVVIDDLGTERQSGYMQEMIYSIIDERYRCGLPLIVTTNLTIEEIKRPGDISYKRIYDRILEMCIPVEINGINRRYRKINDTIGEYREILGM